MPAPPSQAARPMENNLSIYGPGFAIMRKNSLLFMASLAQGLSVIISYRKKCILVVKRRIPRTDANDSCHPASNNPVGLMSKRTIAANESVLRELDFRRKKNDTQKTKHIIAARSVGALGGTISKKTATAIMQTPARARLLNPAVLQSHQIIPIRMPRCIPERLIKCSRPVLRNAL